MKSLTSPVEIFDEFNDAPLVTEFAAFTIAFIANDNSNTLIQERQFLEAFVKCVINEFCRLKNLTVGLKRCLCPDLFRCTNAKGRDKDNV